MKIKFTPTVPEEIEYSMTITMTVKEWIKLKDQLLSETIAGTIHAHPSESLVWKIRDLVHQADKWFTPSEPTPPPLESIAEIFEKAKAKSTVPPEDHVVCVGCNGTGLFYSKILQQNVYCQSCEGKGHHAP